MCLNKHANGRREKTSVRRTGVLFVLSAVLLAVGWVPAAEEGSPEVLAGQSVQSFSFKEDTTLRKALNLLQQMYEKNIVPTEKVNLDAMVTASHLYDVTFEEALEAVLGSNKYEVKDNFIKVYSNEEFMQDKSRFEHATITLYYINSDEALKLATPLISEHGQLGATTAAAAEMKAGEGGDTLAVHDRLVVSDYPENIKRIREMLNEVDTEPIQVLLEVTVMEATLTDTTKFGIDWSNLLDGELLQNGFNQGGFAPDVSNAGLSVGVTIDNFAAVISAVETVSDVTIMANPKILALNKQTGKLIIGREDGYLSLTNSNADGATQQVEFLESGTVLEYRPFVGRDGMIRMEIHPEQSSGNVDDATGLPDKSTTEVITNVMVKDSQTIVLGGLFKEETNLQRSQVPLLGDIPMIGEAFRGVNDTSTRVELIVLITPHIINKPEEADGAARLEDVRRLNYQARQNLYWMSRAKIDEDRYAKAVKLYSEGQFDAALAALDCPYAIDRNYLEKTRLKERIILESQPDAADQLERVMLQKLGDEESGKWMRR